MDKFDPPQALNFEGNLAENWRLWRQELTLYLTATEKDGKDDKIKTSILLTCIGKRGREVYNTLNFPEGEQMKFDSVIEKFSEYCNPRTNITFMRYKFFTYKQCDNQPFDDFVTELKKRSAECQFGTLKDELIRDIIVCGINDNRLRERLLRDPTLTLEKAIEYGQASEETRKHIKEMQNDTATVNIVKKHHGTERFSQKSPSSKLSLIVKCKFCGGKHNRGECPAYGKKCIKCGKLNHFAKCCLSKKPQAVRHVQVNPTNDDSDDSEEFFIGAINNTMNDADIHLCKSKDHYQPEWSVNLQTNGTIVEFKLDTGAQSNVISKQQFYKLGNSATLKKTKVRLTAYNGSNIPVLGKTILTLEHKRKEYVLPFIVADTDSPSILGLAACHTMNLIQRIMSIENNNKILQEYADCFGELGTLPQVHKIHVDKDATPVIHPPRRIPVALRKTLKNELERMERLDVIEKVTEPTDWVNSLVIVQKPNGKIRICLDPRDLNKVIKRHHHQLPTAEDILSRMAGATIFTKLDASSGYWQIRVDEASSKLLTFNTPFGRYKFKRLPFGVLQASEVFQANVAEILEGIDGVQNAQDDIIIWGSNTAEHDQRVHKVMNAIRKSGLKLNESKCVFGVSEVTYLGHKLTSDGVKPDPKKVCAILNMPMPNNKTDLRRFLGMVNYLGKFVPNLTDLTAPLRPLLEKDVLWTFDTSHQQAAKKILQVISSDTVLKYFDPSLPIKVNTDASKDGLGASLEQKHGNHWLPVAFASRAMTQAEQNYGQIEKETLSILFGCEKFHDFLHAQKFIVENDHLPLKAIFNKPIAKIPPRMQRFVLRLYKYDFTMQHNAGKNMIVADTLSRAYLNDSKTEIPDTEMDCVIHSVLASLPISEKRLKQFQEETNQDTDLQVVMKYVQQGWPTQRDDIDPVARPYYNFRDEISILDGLLLKGECIIVPKSLRKEMKDLVHTGHQGIERCKTRAREALYWPRMSSEIADMVSSCDICLQHRNQQASEEPLQHEIPSQAWFKVGMDIFFLNKETYLLIVDYYSKYFEICHLDNLTSKTIILHMKSVFSRHGIPKVVIADNQFNTYQIREFEKKWDFKLVTSSPYYPKSNGMAERTVQTVKKLLKKSDDPYLSLLAYRTTQISPETPSPSYLLMRRYLRTTLPSAKHQSSSPTTKQFKSPSQSELATKPHRVLPELNEGDTVRICDKTAKKQLWNRKAKVIKKRLEPRSYDVITSDGTALRRNRQDLLKTNEEFTQADVLPDDLIDDQMAVPNRDKSSTSPTVTTPLNDSNKSSTVTTPLNNNLSSPTPRITYKTRYGRNVVPPLRYGFSEH